MKKITLLCCLTFSFALFAQVTVFEEDFDGSGPGFGSWVATDVDGQAPNANDYSQAVNTQGWAELDFDTQVLPVISADGFDQADILGNVMGAHSWYSPVGQSNDWVVSPQIDLTNATGGVTLTFDALSVAGNPNFNEDYRVLVSTTGTDINSDFTEVLDVELENNVTPTTQSVDLSAYEGEQIYIAWHDDSNDRWGVVVDNVLVAATTLSVDEFSINSVKHYFNYDTKVLTLNSQVVLKDVVLYNVLGQESYRSAINSNISEHALSGLQSGIYIAKINSIDNKSKTIKLVVK